MPTAAPPITLARDWSSTVKLHHDLLLYIHFQILGILTGVCNAVQYQHGSGNLRQMSMSALGLQPFVCDANSFYWTPLLSPVAVESSCRVNL